MRHCIGVDVLRDVRARRLQLIDDARRPRSGNDERPVRGAIRSAVPSTESDRGTTAGGIGVRPR